jgi:hypothetical protein
METVIRINTNLLNIDILEGIKKLFLHKKVEILIQEDDAENEEDTEGEDEDATEFIMKRPAFAAELLRRIKSIENNEAQLIEVKLEDLVK